MSKNSDILCEKKFLDKSTKDVEKMTMSHAIAFPLHFAVFLEVIGGVDVGLSKNN